MPTTSVPLGPGTITLLADSDTGQPVDFSCEVASGAITHTYADAGESKTMLCGRARSAAKTRQDGITLSLENDLSAAGLYNLLVTNDLAAAAIVYTPNTAAGASWAGDVVLTLPGTIGADQFGAPLVSEVAWSAIGPLVFTPAPDAPAPAAP